MPRSPILSREAFYDTLPDGSLRLLDWCVVDTVLGAMIEPRAGVSGGSHQAVTQVDVYDMDNFTKLSCMDEDKWQNYFFTGGSLVPRTYAV